MFEFLGRLAVTHPWKVLVAWLLAAVGLFLTAPSWDSHTQDDDVRFLPERCASVRGYQLLSQAFPQEVFASRAIFTLERSDGPLRAADFALVDRLVAELETLRQTAPELQIGKVMSCRDPLIGRRLTSEDGRCTLIQLSLGTPYLAVQTQATVEQAESLLRRRMDEAGPDAPLLLTTGAAGIGRDLFQASGHSLERTTLATVVLVVVLLLLVYRSPVLILVPLLTIAVSVWVALQLLALVTLVPGVHLVTVSRVFAVVILYGAGTDYCLFLISRYREELEEGGDEASAIARAVTAVGGALAASAGTVVCGLSLMGFADFAKVRCAGPAIALALAVALAASLTLAPALLRLLGGAVFWPRRAPSPTILTIRRSGTSDDRNGFWERISRLVVARPLLIWSASLAVLLPFCVLGLCVSPAYKPTGELSSSSESIRGMKVIRRHFTAGETGPLTVLLQAPVDWNTPEGRQLVHEVSQGLGRLDNVAEVRSLTQPLGRWLPAPRLEQPVQALMTKFMRGLTRPLADVVEQANHAAREHYLAKLPAATGPRFVTRLDVILRPDPFDPASTPTLEKIESWLAAELPRSAAPMGWVEPELFGVTVHARDLAEITSQDQVRVNRLVLGAIFAILLVLVRKLWLAAYLLLTVLVSYFATLGATALASWCWSGAPLGQLDWRVPFFLFTILVAVGEDYNILLVSRILQERKQRGSVEGIRFGLARTGGTITACGLIMAGTFATLILGGLNTLVQVGFALAFGVLVDTFLVRPFLVPAFLLLVWGRGTPAEPVRDSNRSESKPPLAA